MKKIALVLTLLLVIGMAGAFAEVGLSGEFQFGVTNLGVSSVATTPKVAEINLKATVDEFTTVAIELDAENVITDVAVDDFRVTSDITGALGVDAVSLSVTAGYFDAYLTNFSYVTRTGNEFWSAWGTYLGVSQPTTDMAILLNVGVAGYSLKYWQDFAGTSMMVSFSGAPVDMLSFLVGYAADFPAVAEGAVWVEASLSVDAGPVALTIPASFTYDLGGASYDWSAGLAADYDAYHLGVGAGNGGTLIAELSTSVVENADIYVGGYFDYSGDIFQAVDLGASYKFGAFKLGAGYVIAGADTTSTSVVGGNYSVTGSGAYLYCDVDF